MSTDIEAVVYLMLQNQMLHDLFPSVVTVGEDVSGMPTFCLYAPLPCFLICSMRFRWCQACRSWEREMKGLPSTSGLIG
jgi:hypothetical protein